MSDYDSLDIGGGASPDEGGPDDVGQTTGDGQTADQTAYEEPKNYLEVDEVADRYVRVVVDGEEVEVPLGEALKGYSRQADYTRKTQQLAQDRQQAEYALSVQRALQSTPATTIRVLAEQYGVDLGSPSQSPPPSQPQQQGWEQPSTFDEGDDDLMDPFERRLNQTQRQVEQLAQAEEHRAAQQQLNAAIGGLQRKYQVDESTLREVIGTALQSQMGPAQFEMIYKNIAYDREQQARAAAMATRQAQETQREASKTRGQQLVGQGPSANGAGGQLTGTPDGQMSIQEAYDAALKQHGVT